MQTLPPLSNNEIIELRKLQYLESVAVAGCRHAEVAAPDDAVAIDAAKFLKEEASKRLLACRIKMAAALAGSPESAYHNDYIGAKIAIDAAAAELPEPTTVQ